MINFTKLALAITGIGVWYIIGGLTFSIAILASKELSKPLQLDSKTDYLYATLTITFLWAFLLEKNNQNTRQQTLEEVKASK